METRLAGLLFVVLVGGLNGGVGASVTQREESSAAQRGARQTGVGTTGLEPMNSSPWSIYYWFGQQNVNEALSVLFPGIGEDPLICSTTERDFFETGLCMRIADCPYYGGESYGTCGGGMGSCCVFQNQCSSSTDMMVSQFTSKGAFTDTRKGGGECKLTVNPRHNNICQYRLDFDSFNIAQPDRNSECTQDFLGVTGGSYVPKLCGSLTGDHMYVNVEPGGGPIMLTVDTSQNLHLKRDWNIKITQIDCNSPYKAPSGCLQFYNETSGIIRSFNFKGLNFPETDGTAANRNGYSKRKSESQISSSSSSSSTNENTGVLLTRDEFLRLKQQQSSSDLEDIANIKRAGRNALQNNDMRQIQNLNYGICINAKVGYCELTWTQAKNEGPYSFTVTGDASVPADQLTSEFGVENCKTDYVTIPGGTFIDETGAQINAVRYCGTKFPEVRARAQPYVLHVTSDKNEDADKRNLGFALNFRQNLCSPNK